MLLQVTGTSAEGDPICNGRVHSAVFGNIAVIVEVNCETSFAAQHPQFGVFLQDISMQIASCNPKMVGRDYVGPALDPLSSIPPPPAVPDNSILLNQVSVIPDHKGQTIQQVLNNLSDYLGETVVIRRFTRYELGA
jgi:elongation factor Ts